ncbi:MAG: hypothetical protein AAB492_04585 [Patescibacteria group bacterium]
MSPLKVTVGAHRVQTLGPFRDHLHLTQFGRSIFWHGDDEGKAVITGSDGQAEFELRRVGQRAGIDVSVFMAPVEKGEAVTPTTLHIGLERV